MESVFIIVMAIICLVLLMAAFAPVTVNMDGPWHEDMCPLCAEGKFEECPEARKLMEF